MAIPVRAIKPGFFGGIHRIPGHKDAEFSIDSEKQFSKKWMEKVDGKKPAKGRVVKTAEPEAKQEPETAE